MILDNENGVFPLTYLAKGPLNQNSNLIFPTTLPKTNSSPLNMGRIPKMEVSSLPVPSISRCLDKLLGPQGG